MSNLIRRERHCLDDRRKTAFELSTLLLVTIQRSSQPVKHRPQITLEYRQWQRIADQSFGMRASELIKQPHGFFVCIASKQVVGVLPEQRIHFVASPEMTVTIAPLHQPPVHPVPNVVWVGRVRQEVRAVLYRDRGGLRRRRSPRSRFGLVL